MPCWNQLPEIPCFYSCGYYFTHEISNLETVSISATSRLEQQHTNYITVIISGDYALYPKLNVSSLNIILRDIYSLKATTDSLPQILKVN